MPYIGAGIQRFNTADSLTVNGDAEVTGTVNPSGDTASGDAAAVGFTSTEGLILTGQGSTSDITLKNDADATVFTVPTGTDDILFPDNAKAIFGAGSDLRLYHDGNNSYVEDAGSGYLVLKGSDPGIALQNSSAANLLLTGTNDVSLLFSGNAKLATTNTGIDVTGTVTADGLDLGTTTDDSTVSSTASDYQLQLGSAQSTTGDIGRNISFGFSGTTTAAINTIDGGTGTNQSLGFFTHNNTSLSERMRIDSGGNVMFNQNSTSSPGFNNTTQGAVISDTGRLFSSVNGAWSLFNRNTDNGDVILFRRSGSGVGSISVTTSSTSYNTSSDYRLKENIADITGAIARVKQLAPKRFNFIADPDDTTVDGFLAHEAQTVVPEAVTGTHNGLETWTQREIDDGEAPDGTSAGDNKLDEDGNTIPEMQGIDQSKLVPLLTAALKEAITKIETLETEMTALKARVTALEGE
jgi:hypothetical protein